MTDLVDAYQRREVHLAEKILKGKPPPCLFPKQIEKFSIWRQPFNHHGRQFYPFIHRRIAS
jgi:hypothetical protein